MKKLRQILLGAILGMGLLWSGTAQATCDISSSFTAGQVLTAAQLNTLVTDSEACTNNVLNGDTFTGNMLWHSGTDALFYSDTGSTLKAAIYGDSGRIRGYQDKVGVYNLNVKAATTTNANDSIIVECGNETCSATNPGFVVMESGTVGDLVVFTVTADVTLDLTGAHWENGTRGDLTDALLRVGFANDNGTLRTCVALLGGRKTVVTTDTNATATNINLAEEILCDTAVASSTNTYLEWAWFRANFDDADGAASDLWAVQTGVGDVGLGSADGMWQPWNPVFAGFSADPTVTTRFTQIGRTIHISVITSVAGTSNATNFTMTIPADSRNTSDQWVGGLANDNGTVPGTPVRIDFSSGSTITLYQTPAGSAWTGSGNKYANFAALYEVGPAASFIP